MGDLRRLYVGGLFEHASEGDVEAQFSRFGKVESVEIKVKRDFSGNMVKTFAYVDLHADDAVLKKCFSAYNKTKWKGSELKVQLAKEDFIKRLEEERKYQVNEETVLETEPVCFEEKFSLNELKSKTPGTLVPGEKNWVVGKYGRILPVVYIRRKDKQKVTKIDPTKYSHNLKKLKENDDVSGETLNPDSLTWTLDEKDSENDRKRKGIFPEWQSRHSANKKKNTLSIDKLKSHSTAVDDINARCTSPIDDYDMEICEVGTVKLNELPGFVRNKQSTQDYDSSGDSAGTDEIISLSKSKNKQIVKMQDGANERTVSTDNGKRNSDFDKLKKSPEATISANLNSCPSNKREKIKPVDFINQKSISKKQNDDKLSCRTDNKKLRTKSKPTLMEFKGTKAAFSDESDDEICGIPKNNKQSKKPKSQSQSPVKTFSGVNENDSSESDSEETDSKRFVMRHEDLDAFHDRKASSKSPAGIDPTMTDIKGLKNRDSSCTDSDDELTSDNDVSNVAMKKLTKKLSDKKASAYSLNKHETGQARMTANTRHSSEQNLEKYSLTKQRKTLEKEVKVTGDYYAHKTRRLLTDKEKHEDDNRKRLDSLKQKKKENATQKSLIQQALANVDNTSVNPSNKRYFFDSDSDEDMIPAVAVNHDEDLKPSSSDTSLSEEESSSVESSSVESSSRDTASSDDDSDDEESNSESDDPSNKKLESSEKRKKNNKPLFDSESGDASESEDAFKHKPQFEGKKGSQLMKLQSRFQSDKRFKLSERFLESDSSEDEAEVKEENTNQDCQDEKLNSLKILQEVMGRKVKVDLHEKSKQKRLFKDISSLQYDPSKEDHKQFEREKIAPPKKKKSRVLDKKDTEDTSVKKNKVDSKPKVSREKYFQIESSLSETFKDKKDVENSGFSLLQQFGVVDSGDEDKPEEEQLVETIIKRQNPLTLDSSDEEEDDEEEDYQVQMDQEEKSTDINGSELKEEVNMEPVVVFPPRKPTFFFTEDDYRFKEGEQFYRKENLEKIRWKWLLQRDELLHSYKSRHKKLARKAKERAQEKAKPFYKRRGREH